MINRFAYILFVLMGVLLFASCNIQEDDLIPDDVVGDNIIELQCVIEKNNTVKNAYIITKCVYNRFCT